MHHQPSRRYHCEWVLVSLLILSITLACSQFSLLSRFSYSLYDIAISYTHNRKADPDIMIIVIDDRSLAQIGFWPWQRSVHANLLQRLRGARAIGFDVIFADTDPLHSGDDRQLSKAIGQAGNVVLANFLYEQEQQLPANPIAVLRDAARSLGFINIIPDKDGTVRRIRLFGAKSSADKHITLSMLAVGGENAVVDSLMSRHAEQPYLIPFVGAPGRFQMVSYSDVLFGRVPASSFDNKYVLVGAWSTGMGDRFPTPVSSGTTDNMSGVEVLANVLQAAREDDWIVPLSPVTRNMASVLLVLLLLVAIRKLSPRRVLLATVVAFVMFPVSSLLMLYLGNLWISPVAAMVGVALTYPIWSWRTQEMALSQMSREMNELNREYPLLRAEMALADVPQKFHLSLNDRITELQFALNRVRSLRQFISDSFNAIPDPAVVFDSDHQLTLWTGSAQRYMASLGELTLTEGLDLQTFLNAIIADPVVCRELMAAIEAPEHSPNEAAAGVPAGAAGIHHEDGFEVRDHADNDLLIKSMPTFTSSHRRSGYILNLIDISALRQAERKRDETLRFISHDMRAPQNSILALIDLQKDPSQALPDAELLQRVGQLSERTIGLVEDFVQFTRAEKANIEFVPLNLCDLLQDAFNEFWIAGRTRNIPIVSELEPQYAFIKGDQSLLLRAFVNLLDNAFKYSPDNTTVTCKLVSADSFWEVSISDQGRGLSPDEMKQIFTPFTRVGTGEQDDPGGLGLGLVFVKTVVNRHHGDIRVQSVPGHGSDFIVRLPKDEAEESAWPSL